MAFRSHPTNKRKLPELFRQEVSSSFGKCNGAEMYWVGSLIMEAIQRATSYLKKYCDVYSLKGENCWNHNQSKVAKTDAKSAPRRNGHAS
mgnify:CR=1 FL=1